MTTPRVRNANADVGRIVRTLLAHQARSQTELAAYLELDGGSLSRSMKGTRKWTFGEIAIMADFFDVSPAIFFEDAETLVKRADTRGYATALAA